MNYWNKGKFLAILTNDVTGVEESNHVDHNKTYHNGCRATKKEPSETRKLEKSDHSEALWNKEVKQ